MLGRLCFIALLLVAGPAHAADDARETYEHGLMHYRLGEFDAAIRDFKAAYQLRPTNQLLFNLAQCYRQLGDRERALFFYRSFADKAPPSAVRSDADAIVAQLESEELAQSTPVPVPVGTRRDAPAPALVRASTAPVAPALVEPHREAPHRGLSRAGAIAIVSTTSALGVALLATGAGLLGRADLDEDRLEHPTSGTAWSASAQSLADDGRTSTRAATALFVVGGVSLATGIVSAIVMHRALRGSRDSTMAQRGAAWHF